MLRGFKSLQNSRPEEGFVREDHFSWRSEGSRCCYAQALSERIETKNSADLTRLLASSHPWLLTLHGFSTSATCVLTRSSRLLNSKLFFHATVEWWQEWKFFLQLAVHLIDYSVNIGLQQIASFLFCRRTLLRANSSSETPSEVNPCELHPRREMEENWSLAEMRSRHLHSVHLAASQSDGWSPASWLSIRDHRKLRSHESRVYEWTSKKIENATLKDKLPVRINCLKLSADGKDFSRNAIEWDRIQRTGK